jgi:HlyD family secretion protein
VGAGTSLVTIADTSAVIAKVQVEEADISKVRVGQQARVYPIAYETESVLGDVVFVAPRAQRFEDRKTRSFDVRIALRPSQLDVRPGMSCRVDIITEEKSNALVVPNQAVVHDEEAQPPADYVFVVDRGRARRVRVKLGIASDTHQEIVSGLERGNTVVTGPYTTLRRVRNRESVAVRTTR